MAPSPVAQRQSTGTRNRSRTGRPRGRPPNSSRPSTSNSTPGPPLKKRCYAPGGTGGGGRFFEGGTAGALEEDLDSNSLIQTNPRTRVRRDTTGTGSPSSARVYPRRDRDRSTTTPRYSSAAAAAAAVVSGGDGYKPREERGWEEFHPHLDIDKLLMVYPSGEVDGTIKLATVEGNGGPQVVQNNSLGTPNGVSQPNGVGAAQIQGDTSSLTPNALTTGTLGINTGQPNGVLLGSAAPSPLVPTPQKRRPGRPRLRPDPTLDPNAPKIIPPPGPNPKEKLTLPKPSFRRHDPFDVYDENFGSYVDKSMANAGYQESDVFIRPDPMMIRIAEGIIEEDLDLGPKPNEDFNVALGGLGLGRVEYDMDEQDDQWLAGHNVIRKEQGVELITKEMFEITMTKIEKEWHALEKRIPKPNPKPPQTHRPRSSSAAAVNGEPSGAAGEEQDSKCAICDDGDCENTNAIVFCDGCDLAVHQECYGVPFIPEGQWLCRKCQLIGRGTPTCIFCPNVDGAFKQTNSTRWAHLLCAIWIPEVNLGNTTFMEPVMDVERVPKQRWKLTCYICRQKMGACIQCSNKNCFVAFHVTCARRARLFLKMKGTSGGPASLESSQLKAYCDKHVSNEWRRENDVDSAFQDAQEFYRHTMRNRLWADSQAAALAASTSHVQAALAPDQPHAQGTPIPKVNLILGPPANGSGSKDAKRKRNETTEKPTWRLPSGAPVIPIVIYNMVEYCLQRFGIRRRKEFIAEACKFWTLKREARRGAALIKRLQLQMENFSSMEITRRNFAGMGAAGGVRLQRRIDFARKLRHDIDQLRHLCEEVKGREADKLKSAEMLTQTVDTLYFPIVPLLWPMLERAQAYDGKQNFKEGLNQIRHKLTTRAYTSVYTFAADLGAVFSNAIRACSAEESAEPKPADTDTKAIVDSSPVKETNGQVAGLSSIDDALKSHPALLAVITAHVTTPQEKELKKFAKRIIRTIQPTLEDVTLKENQLKGRPFEKELQQMDLLFRGQTSSSRATASRNGKDEMEGVEHHPLLNGDSLPNGVTPAAEASPQEAGSTAPAVSGSLPLRPTNGVVNPPSDQETGTDAAGSKHGGIPWYMAEFDPDGTTIWEERWSGKEVLRSMSEELSSMDEDEVRDLVGGTELVESKKQEVKELAEPVEEVPPVVFKPAKPASTAKKRPKRRW